MGTHPKETHVTRNKQEMALWRRVFEHWYKRELYEIDTCGNVADAAVAEFRKRYPAEPAAPAPVWYDEPPFEKDGEGRHCWVECVDSPQVVYWSETNSEWRRCEGIGPSRPLAGRRVCPITKPPEPTT